MPTSQMGFHYCDCYVTKRTHGLNALSRLTFDKGSLDFSAGGTTLENIESWVSYVRFRETCRPVNHFHLEGFHAQLSLRIPPMTSPSQRNRLCVCSSIPSVTAFVQDPFSRLFGPLQ